MTEDTSPSVDTQGVTYGDPQWLWERRARMEKQAGLKSPKSGWKINGATGGAEGQSGREVKMPVGAETPAAPA